jgi:hypothetical protein
MELLKSLKLGVSTHSISDCTLMSGTEMQDEGGFILVRQPFLPKPLFSTFPLCEK